MTHFWLGDGDITRTPPATDGACIPYLLHKDGKDILCVMEGDAYHQFEIGKRGVARLAAEGAARMWTVEQGRK